MKNKVKQEEIYKPKVHPYLYKGLQAKSYSLHMNLAEAIDNSISNKAKTIYIDIDINRDFITIKDDGEGQNREGLKKSLDIGRKPSLQGLSRYGLGIKQSLLGLGDTITFTTKQKGEKSYHEATFNNNLVACAQSLDDIKIPIRSIPVTKNNIDKSFWYIKIENLTIDVKYSYSNFKYTKQHIGKVYQKIITEDNIKICMRFKTGTGIPKYNDIKPFKTPELIYISEKTYFPDFGVTVSSGIIEKNAKEITKHLYPYTYLDKRLITTKDRDIIPLSNSQHPGKNRFWCEIEITDKNVLKPLTVTSDKLGWQRNKNYQELQDELYEKVFKRWEETFDKIVGKNIVNEDTEKMVQGLGNEITKLFNTSEKKIRRAKTRLGEKSDGFDNVFVEKRGIPKNHIGDTNPDYENKNKFAGTRTPRKVHLACRPVKIFIGGKERILKVFLSSLDTFRSYDCWQQDDILYVQINLENLFVKSIGENNYTFYTFVSNWIIESILLNDSLYVTADDFVNMREEMIADKKFNKIVKKVELLVNERKEE